MGLNPPALKNISTRLNSLEQLLPYANGADAQRAFAPSYMHANGMLPEQAPGSWQQTALATHGQCSNMAGPMGQHVSAMAAAGMTHPAQTVHLLPMQQPVAPNAHAYHQAMGAQHLLVCASPAPNARAPLIAQISQVILCAVSCVVRLPHPSLAASPRLVASPDRHAPARCRHARRSLIRLRMPRCCQMNSGMIGKRPRDGEGQLNEFSGAEEAAAQVRLAFMHVRHLRVHGDSVLDLPNPCPCHDQQRPAHATVSVPRALSDGCLAERHVSELLRWCVCSCSCRRCCRPSKWWSDAARLWCSRRCDGSVATAASATADG
jgi:hypothetical protein